MYSKNVNWFTIEAGKDEMSEPILNIEFHLSKNESTTYYIFHKARRIFERAELLELWNHFLEDATEEETYEHLIKTIRKWFILKENN